MKAYCLLINNPFNFKDPITWLSTLERNVTGSKYNHGAILIFDDVNFFGNGIGWFIVEAIGKGVHIVDLKTYMSYSTDRITDIVDVESLGRTPDFEFLKNQIGKKYQFSIWWSYSLLLISNRLFGENSKLSSILTNQNNPNRWYCFELINKFFGLGLGSSVVGATMVKHYKEYIQNVNLFVLLNRNKLEFTKYE